MENCPLRELFNFPTRKVKWENLFGGEFVTLKISLLVWDNFWKCFSNCRILSEQHTDSTKINRPEHNIRMYWTNFRQPTAHVQLNISVKTLIEVCILHLYASFGTFCVKIGLLFVSQWVFYHSEEFQNRRHFPSKTANCPFSNIRYFKDSLCLE